MAALPNPELSEREEQIAKAAENSHPVYLAQLLTYLKLTDKRLGFVINFNVPLIKHGIQRVVR